MSLRLKTNANHFHFCGDAPADARRLMPRFRALAQHKVMFSRSTFVLVLLFAAVLQACSQLGGLGAGSRRGGADRRSAQDDNAVRPAEATRLSANDQIRLRLTSLRLALKLKPEQAGAWQAFEDKVIEFLSELGSEGGVAADANALAQIERRVIAEQKRAATMQQISVAAGILYSVLSDEQKRVADNALVNAIPVESLGLTTPSQGLR